MLFITISTHPTVIELHVGEDKYKYLLTLYKDNTDRLTKAFGKPSGDVLRPNGKTVSYWDDEFGGRLFRILAGPRGSEYQVEYDKDLDAFREDMFMGKLCCDFLDHIYQTLYGEDS